MNEIGKKFLRWKCDKTRQTRDDLFKEVWQVYHGKLQVYLSQFHRDENDISDIVSDILLRTFESLDRYDSRYSFSTWIYTVARNHQIDLFRKKKLYMEDIEDFTLSDTSTPESILMNQNDIENVRRAVSGLSVSDRELIFLYYYEGMKYREISEITGTPVGTIKFRMSENKKLLKKKLERSLIL
jgi:RNA polymerase sigma-70 factor (ECF subfamily)